MKTEIYIYPLTGSKKSIRDYAKAIAQMDYHCCNAYVMAFDCNNETVWVIQAGDVDLLKSMDFSNVKRVEIYDHSLDSDNILSVH